MSKHLNENGTDDATILAKKKSGNEEISVIQDPDDPNSVIIRTRKRERKRRQSKRSKRKMNPVLKALLIVFSLFVGVAAAVGIAVFIAVNRGNLNLHKMFDGDETTIAKAATRTTDGGQIVEYGGHTYQYNENIVSFVVIGHDDENLEGYEGKSLADTIVLFTLDTATNKMRATVVPRNTWCDVDLFDDAGNYTTTNQMQITLSHGVSLPTTGECAANTVRSVSRIFYNMPISYYIDFGGDVVENATTAIGGVQVEALETIPGTTIEKGKTCLLDGEMAYRYVKYRLEEKDESALDRQDRQVQFIRAFAAKVSGMGVPGLLSVYNGVSDGIDSNLGLSEISYLASCFVTGNNASLEMGVLTGVTKVGKEADGIEYERYHLDEASVMENTLAAFYKRID